MSLVFRGGVLDTKKNGQLANNKTCIERCSKMSCSAFRNEAQLLLFLILISFSSSSPFSSPSFILPKWAPTELDTAQLMATVVAGRAYLAATSHAMKIKKRHRRRACEWGARGAPFWGRQPIRASSGIAAARFSGQQKPLCRV